MKLIWIGALGIFAMCLSSHARADEHPGGAAYATIKAMIDYCGRVDSAHRSEYVSRGAATLASVAGKDDASDYATAYATESATLKRMPASVGRTDCAAAIGSPRNVRLERR